VPKGNHAGTEGKGCARPQVGRSIVKEKEGGRKKNKGVLYGVKRAGIITSKKLGGVTKQTSRKGG